VAVQIFLKQSKTPELLAVNQQFDTSNLEGLSLEHLLRLDVA
jgi:hypothetical protein